MFSRWTIPIYYADGYTGHCDEAVAIGIATGVFNFGAKLSLDDQRKYERYTMARPKKDAVPVPNPMLDALTFLTVAAAKPQLPYQEHVRFANGFAMISNGVITAGFPIEEQFDSYPHYATLLKAVKRGGDKLSITQLENACLFAALSCVYRSRVCSLKITRTLCQIVL